MSDSLPDVLAPDLVVVFVGLNPALGSASAGRNFAGRSNRFWKTLHGAGFTPLLLSAEQDDTLPRYGCGLTTAVSRPTRAASELTTAEYRADAEVLRQKIEFWRPHTVAFLGKAAYAAISGSMRLDWGPQPERFAQSAVWVLPNPSGLNRAFGLPDLVAAYGDLRRAQEDRFQALAGLAAQVG
jgi:TDG/mug DNA glycosylase family protein